MLLVSVCASATLFSAFVVCLSLGRIDSSVVVASPLALIGGAALVHALACHWHLPRLSLRGAPTALAIAFDAMPWLSMLGSILAVAVDHRRLFGIACVLCAYSAHLIATQSIKRRISSNRLLTTATKTSIAMHNVWVENPTPRLCAQQLVDSQVDVVVIVEATAAFLAVFDDVGGASAYPHRFGDDLSDPRNEYCVFICSKRPIADCLVEPLSADGGGGSLVRVSLTCSGVDLLATNLHACLDGPGYVARWRLQMERLCESIAALQASAGARALVLVGDLNTSAFRPEYQRLLQDCRMVDAHALHGRGMSTSLSINGRTMCFARVDHAIVSRSTVVVDEISDMEMCGSDHKPLKVVVSTTVSNQGKSQARPSPTAP
jgi:endonuclease/exonuclease/phosphatase (EEP) superfamily protein YafD